MLSMVCVYVCMHACVCVCEVQQSASFPAMIPGFVTSIQILQSTFL